MTALNDLLAHLRAGAAEAGVLGGLPPDDCRAAADDLQALMALAEQVQAVRAAAQAVSPGPYDAGDDGDSLVSPVGVLLEVRGWGWLLGANGGPQLSVRQTEARQDALVRALAALLNGGQADG